MRKRRPSAKEVRFHEELGAITVGHSISVRTRIIHKADASFASLEQRLFENAKRLLSHASQLFSSKETPQLCINEPEALQDESLGQH
jgi:hypothetical protein